MDIDYLVISRKAVGTLARRGVCAYIEREELVSIGCLAAIASGAVDEALLVTIARRAMVDAARGNSVRARGRVFDEVTQRCLNPCASLDLWESIKALPAREYSVIVMEFWGGLTQSQIAAILKVHQSRVARISDRAKKLLRASINRTCSNDIQGEGKESAVTEGLRGRL